MSKSKQRVSIQALLTDAELLGPVVRAEAATIREALQAERDEVDAALKKLDAAVAARLDVAAQTLHESLSARAAAVGVPYEFKAKHFRDVMLGALTYRFDVNVDIVSNWNRVHPDPDARPDDYYLSDAERAAEEARYQAGKARERAYREAIESGLSAADAALAAHGAMKESA